MSDRQAHIAVLVVSVREARREYEDKGGPAVEEWLRKALSSPARCRVVHLRGHPQFVCHGLSELRRLKGSGRGIEEALGSNRQGGGW